MQARIIFAVVFLSAASLLLDLYIVFALRSILPINTHSRKVIPPIYILLAMINIIIITSMLYSNIMDWPKVMRNYAMMFVVLFLLFKFIFALFLVIDDIWRLGEWLKNKCTSSEYKKSSGFDITRHRFLVWMGLVIASIPSLSLLYGAIFNPYNYKFRRLTIKLPKLPNAFHGIKIIQISDIHSGSFMNKEPILEVIKKINAEDADYLFFTGDIVNNTTMEIEEYIPIFGSLKTKSGIYSILGNHDYGDYWLWDKPEDKIKNLQRMYQVHEEMGWNLLRNETKVLTKDGDTINIIGVENWSVHSRFPKYGNLELATQNINKDTVSILLSHDPTHWMAEVCKDFPYIDLTLSGHTHGFQFGIEIPGWRWSPAQYIYKQWADLYQNQHQYLYVNRGFGFLGYPGRVGIMPEVTIFTLESAMLS